jgi:hypothetical protein
MPIDCVIKNGKLVIPTQGVADIALTWSRVRK